MPDFKKMKKEVRKHGDVYHKTVDINSMAARHIPYSLILHLVTENTIVYNERFPYTVHYFVSSNSIIIYSNSVN